MTRTVIQTVVAGAALALLSWVALTTHDTAVQLSAVNAKVNFLVRFIVPEHKRAEVAK